MAVSLRDVRASDSEMIFGWRNLPDVARYMYTDHVITPDEHQAWFAKAMKDPGRRYWIIQLDDADVGLVNIYDIDREHGRAEWAFYLASTDVRGRGVGSFVEVSILKHVFDELGLRRLQCAVLATNPNVVKMHESFGFVVEGTMRGYVVKGGEPVDVVFLGMLSDEWDRLRESAEARLAKHS